MAINKQIESYKLFIYNNKITHMLFYCNKDDENCASDIIVHNAYLDKIIKICKKANCEYIIKNPHGKYDDYVLFTTLLKNNYIKYTEQYFIF